MCNALAGLVDISINHDAGPIQIRMTGDVILLPDVIQPVLSELLLQLLKSGVGMDPDVRGSIEVVFKPQQSHFPGDTSPADPLVSFHDAD